MGCPKYECPARHCQTTPNRLTQPLFGLQCQESAHSLSRNNAGFFWLASVNRERTGFTEASQRPALPTPAGSIRAGRVHYLAGPKQLPGDWRRAADSRSPRDAAGRSGQDGTRCASSTVNRVHITGCGRLAVCAIESRGWYCSPIWPPRRIVMAPAREGSVLLRPLIIATNCIAA